MKTIESFECVFRYEEPLEEWHLREFLRLHPNLKEFRMRGAAQPPECLIKFCPKLSILDLNHPGFDVSPSALSVAKETFALAFPQLTALKELYVFGNKKFTDAALESLCDSCLGLEVVKMDYTDITSKKLSCLRRLKNLKRLEMSYIRGAKEVTDELLMEILKGFGQNIRQLFIAGFSGITDATLVNLGLNCPKLTKLDITGCRQLSNGGLMEFFDGFISCQISDWLPIRKRRFWLQTGKSKYVSYLGFQHLVFLIYFLQFLEFFNLTCSSDLGISAAKKADDLGLPGQNPSKFS